MPQKRTTQSTHMKLIFWPLAVQSTLFERKEGMKNPFNTEKEKIWMIEKISIVKWNGKKWIRNGKS